MFLTKSLIANFHFQFSSALEWQFFCIIFVVATAMDGSELAVAIAIFAMGWLSFGVWVVRVTHTSGSVDTYTFVRPTHQVFSHKKRMHFLIRFEFCTEEQPTTPKKSAESGRQKLVLGQFRRAVVAIGDSLHLVHQR